MKYPILIHSLAFIAAVALLSFALVGCKTTEPTDAPVTARARSLAGDASAATSEATKASQRSSTHIHEFRSDAERIDYKASRALEILNHP